MNRASAAPSSIPPSGPPTAEAPKAVAPTWADYLLTLIGVALSLLVAEWSGLTVRATDVTPGWVTPALVKVFPYLLFLPVGVIFLWPVFFALARLRGRGGDLTWAEWLWGLVWLLDLLLVGFIAWCHFRGWPTFLDRHAWRDSAGDIVRLTVLIVAGAAVVLTGVTAVQRVPLPWTHHFGLALLLWPVFPFLLLWLGRLQPVLDL